MTSTPLLPLGQAATNNKSVRCGGYQEYRFITGILGPRSEQQQ